MRDEQEPLIKKVMVDEFINKMDAALQLMTEFNNEVGRAALVSCGIQPFEEERTLFFLAAQELTEAERNLMPATYLGLPVTLLLKNEHLQR